MTTTDFIVNRAELEANPDTEVIVEDGTTHVKGCPEITGTGQVTTWAEANGDLWCSSWCIDVELTATSVAENTDAPQLTGSGGASTGGAMASEKALAFIKSLATERGHEIPAVYDLIFNERARNSGRLTAKEASELITYLKLQPLPDIEGDAWGIDEVATWLEELDRKVEHSDTLPDGLVLGARDWAVTQVDVDFEYLAGVAAAAVSGQWERRFAKGTLNCLRASIRRGDVRIGPGPDFTDEDIEGFHRTDGAYYKVQANRNRTRFYVKTWRESVSKWEYVGRAPFKVLTPDTLMTVEEAKDFGHLYGHCCNCGRLLTDENSIEAGIGPICAKKAVWR